MQMAPELAVQFLESKLNEVIDELNALNLVYAEADAAIAAMETKELQGGDSK